MTAEDKTYAVLAGCLEDCQAVAKAYELKHFIPVYDITSALQMTGTEDTLVDLVSLDKMNPADKFLINAYTAHIYKNKNNGFGLRMMNPELADEFVLQLDDWISAHS